jgi:tripartite-type tricarboxylate transporter receptor subunit TctC
MMIRSRRQSVGGRISYIACLMHILCMMGIAGAAVAQPYPNKSIRLVVAYAPGGGADALARMLSQQLTLSLAQPVVVENRAGASGIIGTDFVARSAPDGYTLLLVSTTQLITAKLFAKTAPFDLEKNFSPVAFIGSTPLVLVVNPSLPVHSVQEFVDLAGRKQISYASPGSGSAGHLTMEILKRRAHVDMVHVPYKGTGPATSDLLGGHVNAMVDVLPNSLPYVKTGQLRALAVTSHERAPDLPDVPTAAQAGFEGLEATNWYGVLAPQDTPKDVVAKLNKAIVQALADPKTQEWLRRQGYAEASLTNDAFEALIAKDGEQWAAAIEQSGAKPD